MKVDNLTYKALGVNIETYNEEKIIFQRWLSKIKCDSNSKIEPSSLVYVGKTRTF